MKQAKRNSISSQSCSCTSCLYKSGSERPSLRRFVAQGSRIDKLYYGKYLPLRERKLLEKLVRTRVVYDDVRNQLLSGSSSSISKPDLKPNKRVLLQEHDATKSKDISKLVGLVDKGEVSPSDISSECCSCCRCSSKISLHDEMYGKDIHKYGHTRPYVTSKSSVISKYKKENDELRKNVRFKMKRIRSDPCTCTLKLSGMIKRQSKAVLKKINQGQPEPALERRAIAEEHKTKKRKTAKNIRRSLNQKIERSKSRLLESMEEGARKTRTKLKESKTKLKENFESLAKKSIEKMKLSNIIKKENIETKQIGDVSYVERAEKKTFKIKKDSLTKFKEKLARKRDLNDWECEFECFPEECVHEECFRKIKKQKLRNRKGKVYQDSSPQHIRYEKRVGDTPSKSDVSIKAQKTGKSIIPEKQSSVIRKTDANKRETVIERNDNLEMKQKATKKRGLSLDKKNSRTITTNACGCPIKRRTQSAQSVKTVPRTVSKHSMKAASVSSVTVNKIEKKELHTSKSATKNNSFEVENVPHRHQTSIPKSRHSKDQNLPRKPTSFTKVKRSNEDVHLNNSRQAVRIGSSFSFNIEFHKEKPTMKSSEVKLRKELNTPVQDRKHKLKKKDGHHKARKHTRQHRRTFNDSRQNSSTKYTQSVGHPLKRCFCTLKLKTKETTSISESIQTTKMPSSRLLLPYECEPLLCVPTKCDPKECYKLIQKRNVQYHSVPTNAQPRSKSSSSFTSKPGSSVISRETQVYSIKKPARYKASTIPPVTSVPENKPNKQAVRIGSAFSFDIEFSKGNPTFIHTEKNIRDSAYALKQKKKKKSVHNTKQNKSVDKAKRYIVHNNSQITSSVKSRYTLTKNSLRRCFCTTKLGKHGLGKPKANFASKSTKTMQESVTDVPKKPVLKTVSVLTKKKGKIRKPVQHTLLPYECEPGICVPGDCNPNKCKELLIKREAKRIKGHTRKLNTENIKTKSTSSFTARSVSPSKTKKVQSASETYKSKDYKRHLKTKNVQKQSKSMVGGGRNRQAVRIGSTFSFDVEFFKERVGLNNSILSVGQPPTSVQHHNKLTLKDRDSQGIIKLKQKSELVQAQKKLKNISIDPAIKRCFCTLKLQKSGKKKGLNIGTSTTNYKESMPRKNKTSSVGTKIKENYKYGNQLEPYECEPNICIPGDCNPYRCLEIIKKRDYRRLSHEKRVITDPSKMRSTSSSAQKIVNKSKNAKIQSNIRTQRKSNKSPTKAEPTPSFKFSNRSANINNSKKQSHQSVRVGSKFSFDIEFYKDRSYERKVKVVDKRPIKRDDVKTNKVLKNKGGKPMKNPSIQHKSQGVDIKKHHQAVGIGSIIKRCFCTQHLQNKDKGNNQRTTKQPKVYTVSRMTVEKTNMTTTTTCEQRLTRLLETPIDLRSFVCENKISIESNAKRNSNTKMIYSEGSSFSNVISKTTIQLKSKEMQSYVCNHYLTRTKTEDYKCQNIALCLSKRIKSKLEIKIPKDRSTQTRSLVSRGNFFFENHLMDYIEPDVTELNRRITEITGVRPYLSRCFCTMNIHIAKQEKLNNKKPTSVGSGSMYNFKKSKISLEPNECEPGVCIPGQCDPIACKELIIKRLMKVSKISNTEKYFKSSSSDTQRTSSISKTKKLQSNMPRLPRTKFEKRKLSRVRYEKSLPFYKQAVRIGSNFDFNIEFSKDSNNVGDIKESKIPSRRKHKSNNMSNKRSNKGTKRIGVDSNEKQSQSKSKRMESKASTTTTLLKRCFCTLKLQKKGIDLTIASKKSNTKYKPMLRNDTIKIQTADSSENTKPFKHYKVLDDLGPYECEPQICEPGECNPHECLEIIKKRKPNNQTKGFGVESMKIRQISTSSMTDKQKVKEKQNQLKAADSRQQNQINKSRNTVFKSRHTRKTLNALRKSQEAVHIGSSFSFNVDFFKDSSHAHQFMNARNYGYDSGQKAFFERAHRKSNNTKKEQFCQYFKPTSHRNSQVGFLQNVKSTMTNSFIRRCFCTAKLHKADKLQPHIEKSQQSEPAQWNTALTTQPETCKMHPKKSRSFLKQCFCALKCLIAAKETKTNLFNLESIKSAQTDNTGNAKTITYNHANLEPYECEPNVCTPGECDPYKCKKRIRKRNFKRESGTSVKQYTTKSTSSMAKKAHKSKYMNVKRLDNDEKIIFRRKTKNIRKLTKSIKLSDEPTKLRQSLNATVDNPYRQAVHIGSTYSFDIEFFKNKSYADMQKISKSPKTKPKETVKSVCNSTKQSSISTKNKNTQQLKTLRHRDTQLFAQRVRSTMTQATPFLKRCFCTLKLHNTNNILTTASKKTIANFPYGEHISNIPLPVNTAEKATHTSKKLHTRRWDLQSYECEPGVCIPGKCNPYECERRIEMRENNMCSKLSNTGKYKEMTRFVSTNTKSKTKKSQSKPNAYEKRHKGRNNDTKPLVLKSADNRFTNSPNRQTVHIGSSFSFDIQLYKDKSFRSPTNSYDLENISNLKDKTINNTGSSTIMKNENKSIGNEDIVFSHRQSQAHGPKMEAKGSGVGLLLKRCFCTLKLQKYGKKQQLLENSETKSKNTYITYNAATKANNKSKMNSLVKSVSTAEQNSTKWDPRLCNLENIKNSGFTGVEKNNITSVHTETCKCDAASRSKFNSNSKTKQKSKGSLGTCTCNVGSVVKVERATAAKKIKNKNHFGKCLCDAGDAEPSSGLKNTSTNKKNKIKRCPGKCTCDAGDAVPTKEIENISDKNKNKSKGHLGKCICDGGDAELINQPANVSDVKKKKKKTFTGKCEFNLCKDEHLNKYEPFSAREIKKRKDNPNKCVCDPCGTETVNKNDLPVTKVNKSKGFFEKCPCDPCDSISRKVKNSSEKTNRSRGYSRKSAFRQSYVLEPYECEPNTCTPDVCDPYECFNRIKRRRMKVLGTETVSPTNKSKFNRKEADNKSMHTQNWIEKSHVKNVNTRKQEISCKEENLDINSLDDSHRQVVRIGSSFSFDMEFYKYRSLIDSGKKYMSNRINLRKSKKYIQTPKAQNLKSRASEGKSSLQSQKTQVALINKQSKASGIAPLLKRCFCTLKLQKSRQSTDKRQLLTDPEAANDKPKSLGVIINTRGTSTKINRKFCNLEPYECEPGTCIPGECNLYKCDERIKKRNQRCKSRNIGTHDRFSYVSVSTMTGKSIFSKAKRLQSVAPQTETRIVEQPRFPFISDLKNKQAVRIGSNFSVNIEFYKEILPPRKFVDCKNNNENGYSKKSISNSAKTKYISQKCASINENGSNASQTELNAENKPLFASKVLRRCFCKSCVPQISKAITVGRVEEHRINTLIPPQYCVCYQVPQLETATKKCVCVTETPFCTATKTATTKIDKKYVKCKTVCRNNQSIKSKPNSGNDSNTQTTSDMETILPYTPGKFNKKASKPSLLHSNLNNEDSKGNRKKCLIYCKYDNQTPGAENKINKNRSTIILESTKRLTAKKGKKSIIETKDMKICSAFSIKSAICYCKQIFSKRKNNLNNAALPPDKQPLCMSKNPKLIHKLPQTDVLKQSQSERRPKDYHETKPKKSKSLKITNASKKNKCQCCDCKQGGKIYSKFQSGDANQEQTTPNIVNVYKSVTVPEKCKKFNCPHCQIQKHINTDGKYDQQNKKVVQFFVDPANSYVNEVRKNHPTLVEFMANFICTSNKNDGKRFQSSKPQNIMAPHKTKNSKQKRHAGKGDAASKSFVTKNKINQSLSNNIKVNKKSCPHCETKKIKGQSEIKQENLTMFGQPEYGAKLKITPKCSKPVEKKSKRSKRDKKAGNFGTLDKKPNKQCACKTMSKKGIICECIHKGKHRSLNIGESILNLLKPQKACVCHSSRCECAKVYEITQRTKKKMEKILKLRARNLKRKRDREKYAMKYGKNKKKIAKQKRNKYNARQKQYKKEDDLRRKQRLASDKYLAKRLKSIKNTGDFVLAAESLCDIAKLGCTVIGDVARSSCRTIKHPCHTYQRVKTTAKSPNGVWPAIKTAIRNSGASATCKRVRWRIRAMQKVKSLKNKLKQYAFTNYLMNMTNKDPRKRMKRMKQKKGKIRKREPMDFQCSLYMASLRKRPCLCVYYTCPWFYPHFVTLLLALKQFSHMLLFLLAVVVWSPCILCMELCRTMMCCFLCTG